MTSGHEVVCESAILNIARVMFPIPLSARQNKDLGGGQLLHGTEIMHDQGVPKKFRKDSSTLEIPFVFFDSTPFDNFVIWQCVSRGLNATRPPCMILQTFSCHDSINVWSPSTRTGCGMFVVVVSGGVCVWHSQTRGVFLSFCIEGMIHDLGLAFLHSCITWSVFLSLFPSFSLHVS
ncbi:hypothetical protein VTN77DRAFT_1222 [Rasamsonia byssochlamydoides]|uniref:uncharacterized protein n=1 Tax=Rasamsonia byssochlamydoides TaxID=89139 RepID=UPI0037423C87